MTNNSICLCGYAVGMRRRMEKRIVSLEDSLHTRSRALWVAPPLVKPSSTNFFELAFPPAITFRRRWLEGGLKHIAQLIPSCLHVHRMRVWWMAWASDRKMIECGGGALSPHFTVTNGDTETEPNRQIYRYLFRTSGDHPGIPRFS